MFRPDGVMPDVRPHGTRNRMQARHFSFDQIDKHGPQELRETFDIPASELDREEVESLGPVSIEARAEKGDLPGEYVTSGTVSFTADLLCSRCVDPYPFANTADFHVRYRARPLDAPVQEDEEVELSEGELDIEYYTERELSLRSMALEQIQLTIPMKPLCSESCLGLCPKCGANKNRETCNCETSLVDDRWDALRGIREQLKKSDS
jgi:uncharacterized protein